ncbi:MAG: hypothetical protein JWM90_1202 [Thermoleophilia bacterium]|nr:hypothetical protein [Thermoleophilia bacterium]
MYQFAPVSVVASVRRVTSSSGTSSWTDPTAVHVWNAMMLDGFQVAGHGCTIPMPAGTKRYDGGRSGARYEASPATSVHSRPDDEAPEMKTETGM